MKEEFTPRIYGKYYLIDRIAVGGMAEIYAAKTFSTAGFAKTLVIKRILSRYSENRSFVSMFIDEAKISVSLQHSNICQVYDFGRIKDNYYLAMEFVDGRDVKRLFNKLHARREVMPQDHAVYIAHEACKALDYAHRLKNYKGEPLNIVHQDVSPSNVVVSFNGDIKVVDFGIAKTSAFANDVKDGINWGKVSYVSPERLKHAPPSPQCDIFSVGVVLWECLTGRPLFKDKDPKVSARKILSGDYPAPSIYNPAVPPALDLIVLRALAKEPEDRFADAGEMQEILYDFLGNKNPQFIRKSLVKYMTELFDDERKVQHARMERGSRMAQEFHESLGDVFEFEGGSSGSVPMSPDLLDALGLDPDLGEIRHKKKTPNLKQFPAQDDPTPPSSAPKEQVNLRHALDREDKPPGSPLPDLRPRETTAERLDRVRAKGGGPQPNILRPPPKLDALESEEPETEDASDPISKLPAGPDPVRPTRAAHIHGVRPKNVPSPESESTPGQGRRILIGVAIAALIGAIVLFAVGRPDPADSLPGAAEVKRIQELNPNARDQDGSRRTEGWVRLRNGTIPDIVAARASLETSVAYDPKNASSLSGLALAYAMLSERDPDLGSASIELLRRARTVNPEEPAILRAQAGMDIAFDNAEKAVEDANACLEVLPDDAFCRLYLGLGQLETQDLATGSETLLALGGQLPSAALLWVGLADAEADAGLLAQAEQRLLDYQLRVQDDPRAHTSLARLYQMVGNYRKASEHADRAVDLDDKNVEALLIQGSIALHANDDPGAAWHLLGALAERKILDRHPLQAEVLVQASNAAFAAGEHNGAAEMAARALEEAPGWGPAAHALARARSVDEPATAIEALQAVNLASLEGREKARYHYGAAVLLTADDRLRSAQTELESALSADPGWLAARLLLTQVLVDLDSWDKAIEVMEEGWRYDIAQDRVRDRVVLVVASPTASSDVVAALDRATARESGTPDQHARLRGMALAGECVVNNGCIDTLGTLQTDLRDGSGSSNAWVGRALLANQRWQAALVQLGRIPLAERNAFVSGLEGFAHEGLRRTSSANTSLESAYAEGDSTAAGLHRRHSELLMTRGEREPALTHAELAFEQDPDDMVSAALLLTYGKR
ncbi:MAG: protein kinase [Proteobacteria bacterium]|nr:protein kinase [Pseudomonadota bacterium]MCP4917411.1 protein kinase [Pseudomonadota bacterium]